MNAVMEAPQTSVAPAMGQLIEEQHRLALQHRDAAVRYAVAAGQMLLGVKAMLPHGEFLPWLEKNVSFTARTAQRYMAAAAPKPIYDRSVSHSPKRTPTLPRHKQPQSRQRALAQLDECERRDDAVAHVAWLASELPLTATTTLRPDDITLLKQLRAAIDGLLEGAA